MRISSAEILRSVENAVATAVAAALGTSGGSGPMAEVEARFDAWVESLDRVTQVEAMNLCIMTMTQAWCDAGTAAAGRGEDAEAAMKAFADTAFNDERFYPVCLPALSKRFPEVQEITKAYHETQQRSTT